MAETLVAILLVTSSGKGKNVAFWWPPRPKSLARISRARPDRRKAFVADNTDIQWRAAFSPECDRHIPHDPEDDESYEWTPPTFVRHQSSSQARSTSSGRCSPVIERSFDRSRAGDDSMHNDGAHAPQILGYPLNALATLLAPAALCHQKFELLVDELVFIGHPVCRDPDGSWPPVPSSSGLPDAPDEYSRNLDGIALTHSLHLFHLVFVLDRPDPSSASTGNLARYYEAIYRQLAFKLTAALYSEQGATGIVDNECEFLEELKLKVLMRDPYENAGKDMSGSSPTDPIDVFTSTALQCSLAVAIKKTYEAIKSKDLVDVAIGEMHVQVQLPPYLDALLHDPEDVDYPSDEEDESNWGVDSLGWRLPPFTLWKSLLLMKDLSELEIIEDLGQSGLFEGDIKSEVKSEEMLEFLDHARPDLTFHEIYDLLAWESWDKFWKIVRILVANRKAMIIDPIHPGLRAPYVPVPGSTLPHKLIRDFEEDFASERDVPPLPAILSDISQRPRETFATVLDVPREQGPKLQMWMNVLKWLIRRRVVVRLHTRIRIRVPTNIKEVVRKERAVRAAEVSQKRKLAQVGRPSSTSAERRGRPRTREVKVSWDSDDGRDRDRRVDSGFEDDEAAEDDWDEVDWHDDDDNLLPSVIPAPHKATALQRMWLEVMTRGKDPLMAERFRRLADYFDGTATEDEIIQINADYGMDRRAFRDTVTHFKDYLIISMHP
ncbi:hypothetical protein EXIGLDRAFT_377196 [Exidia glandulosa HHB12029]|uniref:Nitrogen permease regulator 3 n=1 Tax=Exidia glandulosa HHB12029 TaxID=1314781 RepID=A0A165Q0N6_EXIGL|nr:hypothetical protein EXIGLDRAFT_377196 [Exidia glandulosa HHB12029]